MTICKPDHIRIDLIWLLCTLAAIPGCNVDQVSNKRSASNNPASDGALDDEDALWGHYEGKTSDYWEKIAALKPVALPEWAETRYVVIGRDLVGGTFEDPNSYGYGSVEFGKALLETGVPLWIVSDKSQKDGSKDPELAKFTDAIKEMSTKPNYVQTKVSWTNPKRDNYIAPTIWARDWGPLLAVTPRNKRILIDQNYFVHRPIDDSIPEILTAKSKNEGTRLSLPIYNEGGNFMINGRGECMMTTRVVEANADLSGKYYVDKNGKIVGEASGSEGMTGDPRGIRRGRRYVNLKGQDKVRNICPPNSKMQASCDKIMDEAEIKQYYQRFAGCSKVHVFPRMPIEGTGHIDMWAKFLNDDTILVSKVPTNSVQSKYSNENAQIANYLDERIADLKKLGYNVVNIPIPLPQEVRYLDPETNSDIYYWVNRSYTNSLFVTKNGKKYVFVPRFQKGVFWTPTYIGNYKYEDADLLQGYEAEVAQAYSAAGYQVIWVPSDHLIDSGGAVHCTVMQVTEKHLIR